MLHFVNDSSYDLLTFGNSLGYSFVHSIQSNVNFLTLIQSILLSNMFSAGHHFI